MKKNLSILLMVLATTTVWAQESMFTLSGGYSFANVENIDTDMTGFRINGLYEFNPNEGKVAHGLSIGYIGVKGDYTYSGQSGNNTIEVKSNTWPIYYAPKYLFGGGSAKGFIKGALGMQFSGLNYTGPVGEVDTSDAGFYGGLGAGFMKTFNEKFFIAVEYEWAYMSNSFYTDGFMNTVSGGIGMKF